MELFSNILETKIDVFSNIKKRNGEVRYVKHDLDQTGLRRLVKQMDKSNRFRSNWFRSTRPRQTGQRRTASDKLSRFKQI